MFKNNVDGAYMIKINVVLDYGSGYCGIRKVRGKKHICFQDEKCLPQKKSRKPVKIQILKNNFSG